MKAKNIVLFGLIIFISVTSIGCFGVTDDFKVIRSQLFNDTKLGYKKDIEFSVGKVSLSIAKFFVHLSDDDREAEEVLSSISSAQIGVYKTRANFSRGNIRNVINSMEKRGWIYIVKNIDKDESSMIFVKNNNSDSFTDLFVIASEHGKVNLVEVHGNLDRIVEMAIKDKDAKLGFAKK